MPYKITSFVLVVLVLHSSIVAQSQSPSATQTTEKMQQVLHKAREKNKAVRVTLREAVDSQKIFDGNVGDISDHSFILSDRKTRATRSFTYAEVQQIKQKGMSKGAKIAIIGLVAVGGVIAMGFAVACHAEGGPHC